VPYEQGAIRVSERSSIQLWSEALGNLQDWSTFLLAMGCEIAQAKRSFSSHPSAR
jgi:hypothetical protein